MLYRMRGRWNSIYKRFNAWSAGGKWLTVFNTLIEDPDFAWALVDGSYVKAHRQSAGAASGQPEAIGKSRGGPASKMHWVVDAHGLPVALEISGGEGNDCTPAPELIARLPSAEVIVADKGYASERIRQRSEDKGALPMIPRKRMTHKSS